MTIYLRKFRAGVGGPWHRSEMDGLTLCGRRLPGIRAHRKTPPPEGERLCDECVRRGNAGGTQRAYRSR